MKKITIVAYAICFLSGLWFLFSSVKDDFGILIFYSWNCTYLFWCY